MSFTTPSAELNENRAAPQYERNIRCCDGVWSSVNFTAQHGFHTERLKSLTGLRAEQNQARRLLHDMRRYGAVLDQRAGCRLPDAVVTARWLDERRATDRRGHSHRVAPVTDGGSRRFVDLGPVYCRSVVERWCHRQSLAGARASGVALTVCLGAVCLGAVCVGMALSACSSSSSVDEAEVRAAAVYESIVRWFAEADETDPDPLPLYVEPRGEGTEIALAVQAELVGAVRDVAAVRFVDSREEALITNESDPPVVANDGVLVRLGPVNDTSRVVSIDVDVYDERADADGVALFRTFEFQLISAGERWVVSGSPNEVPSR